MRPYGDAYEAGRCNLDEAAGGLEAVMSRPGCVGGVPALFDMLGNANEWIDSCEADEGAGDLCVVRDAFYASPPSAVCATVGTRNRSSSHSARGFRCCAP